MVSTCLTTKLASSSSLPSFCTRAVVELKEKRRFVISVSWKMQKCNFYQKWQLEQMHGEGIYIYKYPTTYTAKMNYSVRECVHKPVVLCDITFFAPADFEAFSNYGTCKFWGTELSSIEQTAPADPKSWRIAWAFGCLYQNYFGNLCPQAAHLPHTLLFYQIEP